MGVSLPISADGLGPGDHSTEYAGIVIGAPEGLWSEPGGGVFTVESILDLSVEIDDSALVTLDTLDVAFSFGEN